ncbi:ribonuclease H family protein [Calycomorphotria hydatis]|uniref:Ribonuclease HIII n=1 Tax=Calycomorphotria hydatis TaxID=2528027 RepID=A0A517TEZ0_9PLAN|nr:hypothetical protein [Calycomorphotria hydatis]QDT66937.1 Hypothetical protein V22_42090 [Calycomorphotria hydatis]
MGTIIGIDEAGYGPTLGPLVIAATVWSVPGDPREAQLWELLADHVDERRPSATKLHIADSKQVHSSAKGIAALERSAWALLELAGLSDLRFDSLLTGIACSEPAQDFATTESSLPTPVAVSRDEIAALMKNWQAPSVAPATLKAIKVAYVLPTEFNRQVAMLGTKGQLLSRRTFQLLHDVLAETDDPAALIFADKHGGRDRYADLLADVFTEEFPIALSESSEQSRYRLGQHELRLTVKGERELPVAAASIIAKYIRELAMLQFNAFWATHLPDIKPTKGYPQDAKRFLAEIELMRAKLGISLDDLKRCR